MSAKMIDRLATNHPVFFRIYMAVLLLPLIIITIFVSFYHGMKHWYIETKGGLDELMSIYSSIFIKRRERNWIETDVEDFWNAK
jgi:hypothetical protein